MKFSSNKFRFSILVYFIFILVISSCSVLKNASFTKRKYTKGHYHDNYVSAYIPTKHKLVENLPTLLTNNTQSSVKNNSVTQPVFVIKNSSFSNTQLTSVQNFTEKNNYPKTEIKNVKYTNNFFKKPSIKLKNALSKNALKNSNNIFDDINVALFIIFYILFVVIYTFAILLKAPSIPIPVAILIALFLALITVVTGQIIAI